VWIVLYRERTLNRLSGHKPIPELMKRKVKRLFVIIKSIRLLKTYSFLLIISLQCIALNAQSQQSMDDIISSFTQYHHSSVKEKIFVHTDKNFYVAGEIMWFKLYTVDASMHTSLSLSKVAYVEIIDSSNKHMLQAKLSLNNGEGNGSFYLPLILNSGIYKLRAYTNWMKNFGPAYFFEKNITIINVQKTLNVSSIKPADKFDVQFFPEGGNLVNNISCKVAFKGINQYGKSVNFTGFLIDNNDTILSFTPQHAGMGFFSFTPLNRHIYKAVIKTDSGQTILKELPAAYNSGYVMNLFDSADKVQVSVQSDLLAQQTIYLFAHTREIIKVAQSRVLQNGKAVFVFDKAILGDGISHITIFNEQKQPVCERLYFKRPAKKLMLKLSTDQSSYTTRKKISLNIEAGNMNMPNDTASISMTVFRLDSLQLSSACTIDSYMLLTSDLKGYIQDPGFYFLKDDEETNTALDNLMLTNGWRRFKWEEILDNTKSYFEYPPEYNGSIIEGTVTNAKTKSPVAGIETYISSPGFQNAFSSSVSDQSGHVAFELKNLYGSAELIFQPKQGNDSIYKVEIKDPYSEEFSGAPFPLFTFSQSASNLLREQSVSMQVQNIYSAKKLKHFTEPVADTIPFYINADAKYLLDNYTRFTTIEEILREYVILVDVKKREGKFHYSVFDFTNNEMLKNDPLILLDGVPVSDLNKFMQTDPLKLYKLEVLNRKYFLGRSLFNGILNWTSYKKDMAGYEPGEHTTIIDYNGLQKERGFYAPVYENDEEVSNHLPDFRNVLLWNPHIKIPGRSSKEINFYTSDLPGKYIIEIQGISKYGECISGFLAVEVKK
jgi:hypothetical protein